MAGTALGLLIYRLYTNVPVGGFGRDFESNYPLVCRQEPDGSQLTPELLRIAGTARVRCASQSWLFGREMLVDAVLANCANITSSYAVDAFNAEWKCRPSDAEEDRRMLHNLPKLAHIVAAHFPDLRDWRVKKEAKLLPYGGHYTLEGILP